MRGNVNVGAPAAAAAAAISAVIGDDDILREILLCLGFPTCLILREILLRLGFPTCLVRAAAVSKRWFRHASDPVFLRRFRGRHPPALLGFYLKEIGRRPRFVPVSQAPELATAIRAATVGNGQFPFDGSDDDQLLIRDCRNALLLVADPEDERRLAVLSPLHPARGMVVLPPRPPKYDRIWFFLPEEGGDGDGDGDAVLVGMLPVGTGLQVDLLTLQSGVWVICRTAVLNPPETLHEFGRMLPPVRGKIYMLTNSLQILRLDFAAANISVIQLPDRVRTANFEFSCGEEVVLVHVKGYLLSMWCLATNGNGTNDWVLVYDKIHVREACNRADEDVMVLAVDNTAEFVFLGLEASGVVICMHLRSSVEKVDQVNEMSFVRITPFKMVWPPTFPSLY